MRKLADSSWLIAHGSWYLVVNSLTRLWAIGYGLLARVFIICAQLVCESREKQWDIFPQKSTDAWTSHVRTKQVCGFAHVFPTFPRQLSAAFYTRNFAILTDRFRSFSTLSTPPITTITIY